MHSPVRIFETADIAREAKITPAGVRASMLKLQIGPDFATSRAGFYSAATVEAWRSARKARGLRA